MRPFRIEFMSQRSDIALHQRQKFISSLHTGCKSPIKITVNKSVQSVTRTLMRGHLRWSYRYVAVRSLSNGNRYRGSTACFTPSFFFLESAYCCCLGNRGYLFYSLLSLFSNGISKQFPCRWLWKSPVSVYCYKHCKQGKFPQKNLLYLIEIIPFK